MIVESIILAIWVVLNLVAFSQHWDLYPFIFFNLVLTLQAAYAGPIIMMSQKRQSERDRVRARHDDETNLAAKERIEALMRHISALETQKIDKQMEGMSLLLEEQAVLLVERAAVAKHGPAFDHPAKA